MQTINNRMTETQIADLFSLAVQLQVKAEESDDRDTAILAYSIQNACSNLTESQREFRAADATIHNLELKLTDMAVQLANAESKCRDLAAENAYIRNRYKELDLLIGKNILVMQAAIIEWQATGDAKNGLAWIYNTLFGPGELPDESEKDAQAYFDRKYAPIDEKLMALHKWFWEQSEAERAAAGIGVKGE
ncbi:ead/Ea22-like family protein [Citrobacter sp. Cpo073]|uniref:ead/Ea22-like family protein n=1 Tax=Citrobacter sp. Cpo073 TaxID=2985134 RepID=UPI002017943B|nr:ead/Ea22-like family protein [Citrobacter sp. Cpo073]MDM2864803.1 ead/Ea22-like family protein [Citrobacter sp. Cpo073]